LVCEKILRKFYINSLKIYPPQLQAEVALPWEIQKGILDNIIHMYF